MVNLNLKAKHLTDLRKSGLTDATIAAARFADITGPDAGRLLGWKAGDPGSAMRIPFVDVEGKPIDFVRVKPDTPVSFTDKDSGETRTAKYLSPKNSGNHAFFPPGTVPVLRDADKPLLMTEGEKKAAKADQEGFACIGLTGVWNWTKKRKTDPATGKKIGGYELIDDLKMVEWQGRQVLIVFDSDRRQKSEVMLAESRLAEALIAQGAVVRIVELPDGETGEKVGLDDFLVAQGNNGAIELNKLIGGAVQPCSPQEVNLDVTIKRRTHRGYWIITASYRNSSHVDEIKLAKADCRRKFAEQLHGKWPTLSLDIVQKKLDDLATWEQKVSDGSDGTDGTAQDSSQADQLVILTNGVELFHDADQKPYVTIEVDGHHETYPVYSGEFKRWLSGTHWKIHRKAVNAQAMTDALSVIAAKAIHDGSEIPVFVRTAEYDGAYWLDLANDAWQAVEIRATGCLVRDNPPVKFLRRGGMLPLPIPVEGGDINELRKLVNIPDDDAWVLILAWGMAALRPVGPYPILVLNGEQGSAKSSCCRTLRSLIDPNRAPLRSEQREMRDLMISANNGWVLAYDNISNISTTLSDAFCRLSTGGGFATRELYTDDGERIFEASRPVIVNGIEELASRSDLLDRSICLSLPKIPDDKRKTEEELREAIEQAAPRILGALLDAMVVGLDRVSEVKLDNLPRMADFAKWAVASETGLGFPEGTFMAAYERNRQDVNSSVLEDSPVAQAVIKLMEGKTITFDTATDMLKKLNDNECSNEQQRQNKEWPKTSSQLGGILRRIAPNLRHLGLDITFNRKGDKLRTRVIHIRRMEKVPSEASEASETAHENSAAIDQGNVNNDDWGEV